MLFALSSSSYAQQAGKIPRVGILGSVSASGSATRIEALRSGLRDLGYAEGKNIVFEFRWAETNYDRLPELAAELARLNVDVLVTHGVPGSLAAKRATTTIPIVMTNVGDAVAVGLIASLARPGGNITGISFFNPELSAKRLELLKEAVPRARQVAVLLNPKNPIKELILQAMEVTARSMNMELQKFELRGFNELENVFSVMTKSHVDALTVIEDPLLNDNARAIADLAAKKQIPSTGGLEIAEAGGLMAYGVNIPELWRRSAVFIHKILKGTKPADLPVEQPTKFELIINLKTAKHIGLTFPPNLLARADRVIR
jgi:putative ABC transport system substrate-binding protein